MIMAGPPGQWPFGPGVNPVVAPGGWLSGVSNPAGISGAGQQNVPSGTGAAGLAAGSNGNAIGVASGFPSGSDLTRSSNGGPDSSGTAPPPVATKVRKPYTITKVRERWTEEEHERFLAALKLYGRAWRKIEAYIGTKSAVQIRSHAQKFFSKLQRESERANAAGGDGSDSGVTVIPPARPKRKPAHPYPRKAPDPATSASGAATAANGNASAFDNAASNVAANLASLGAPGNAAAANFAAALASFAGTSAWGHAGNATAGNPLAGNPFAAAFHPGNPFNPYAVNTVANPLAAMQAAISQAAAVNGGAQAAAQAQAQAQATQHLRATLAALGGAQPAAPAHVTQPSTNAQRPVAAVPDGNAQGTSDLFNAMLAAAAAEGGSDGSGPSPNAGVGGGARNVGSAFTGWTGGSAAQPHASLPATAAPGAAVQPTADQLALAMMLYGYAGAAGVSPSGIPPAGIPPAIPPKAEEAEPAATRDQRAARSAKEKGKAAVTDPEPRDVDGDEGSDGGGSGGSGGSGGGGSGGSGSGERGSGNSDQTKATRRSDPLPKRSSRGFESSSQREASPPERLR